MFITSKALYLNMEKGGYVYIMSSPDRTALYTGVTAKLYRRIWEHRNKEFSDSFLINIIVLYLPITAIILQSQTL